MNYVKKKSLVFLFLFINLVFYGQKTINLQGLIVDKDKYPIPYAAVSILSKSIGTASNDDGGFILKLKEENLNDTITVSTLGFKTFKIKVQEFLYLKEKIITLVEDVVSLDEITIINYVSFVKDALKNLRNTSYRKGHQLNILYRRFSNENKVSRFLVEHYLKIYDRGPTSREFDEIEIAESRKSNDYRFVKKKQTFHAAVMIAKQNPLRKGIYRKDYNWKVVDDTSYDGEDVIVIEGKLKDNANKWIKLYIGVDTKAIYKLENSNLKAVYIYKKNKEGQLVLSYHNREYVFKEKVTPYMRKILKLKNNTIKLSYRHEAIVLGIILDRKKINVSGNIIKRKDIGDYNIKYNPDFWKNINLPPDSKFYKQSAKQLESLYGVPLENQFKLTKF